MKVKIIFTNEQNKEKAGFGLRLLIKKAVKAVIKKTDDEIDGNESDYLISMFYADSRADIMDTIAEHYSDSKYSFSDNLFRVGATIGAHTGPDVIALAYSKKYNLYTK